MFRRNERMKLGLALPQYGPLCDATRISDFAATAEKLGYQSLWVGDRLLTPVNPSNLYPDPSYRPYPSEHTRGLDPLVVLSVAAAATTDVRLSSSTINAPLYEPALLGRALTSIDVLSNGRLDVGVGLGWLRDEYDSVSVNWDSRGARLDEILDLWDKMWSTNPVQHHGEFFEMKESILDLRPTQVGGPPILLGGFAVPALRRVGRRGAGWLMTSDLPADYEAMLWNTARQAAAEADRDPDALRKVCRINPRAGSDATSVAQTVTATLEKGTEEVFVDLSYCARGIDHALEIAADLIGTVEDRRP
jgi:probable F420-dependent oxidoreductase